MAAKRDIRIDHSVWREASEIYSNTKLALERNKENEKNNILSKIKYWQGLAAETYKEDVLNRQIEEGNYKEVQDRVGRMCSILEENDAQISSLLVRCNGFIDNVNSNSYVDPCVSPALSNEGVLEASYDKIQEMMTICDEICLEAKSLQNSINYIMDSCGSLVANAGMCQEQVDEAYLTLHRVDNFRQSMDLYVSGLQSLEENINIALRALSFEERTLGGLYDGDITDKAEIADIYRLFKDLGYTDEDILVLDIKGLTEADIDLLRKFVNREYEKAFLIDPRQLSEMGKRLMALYILQYEYIDYPKDYNGEKELEKIINALLMSSPTHCKGQDMAFYYNNEYINIFVTEMERISAGKNEELRDAMEGECNIEQLQMMVLEGKAAFNQYALWKSIQSVSNLEVGCLLDIAGNAYREGDAYLEIDDLEGGLGDSGDGAGAYGYILYIKNADGSNAIEEIGYKDGYYIVDLSYPSQAQIAEDDIMEKLKELIQQKENIYQKTIKDTVNLFPTGKATTTFLDMLRNNDLSGIGDLGAEKVVISYLDECEGWSEPKVNAAGMTSDLIKVLFVNRDEYGRLDKQIEETQQEIYNRVFGNFVKLMIYPSYDSKKIGVEYIGYQEYSAETIYRFYTLAYYPELAPYLKDILPDDISKEEFDAKQDDVMEILDKNMALFNNPAYQALIRGNSEMAYTPDDIIAMIQLIETEMDNYFDDDAHPLRDWLNP